LKNQSYEAIPLERNAIQTVEEAIAFLLEKNKKPYWDNFGSQAPRSPGDILHFSWPGAPSEDFLVTVPPLDCVTRYPHTHDFFVLNYCYQGPSDQKFQGADYTFESGDIYFLQPNVCHQVLTPLGNSGVSLCIYLRKDFIHRNCLPLFKDNPLLASFFTEVVSNPQSSNYLILRGVNMPDMKKLAEMMILDTARLPSSHRALLFSSLIKMMALLSDGVMAEKQKQSRQKFDIDAVLTYLNEHYADATMETTAQHFNYNPSYFSTCIRRATGRSFSDILKAIRLDRAADLLRHSTLTVREVASLVGYTHMGNFYKLFHSRFGVTPKQLVSQRDENLWQDKES